MAPARGAPCEPALPSAPDACDADGGFPPDGGILRAPPGGPAGGGRDPPERQCGEDQPHPGKTLEKTLGPGGAFLRGGVSPVQGVSGFFLSSQRRGRPPFV